MAIINIDSNILKRLKDSLSSEKGPITVADASLKSGLSFLDAKTGLNYLCAEYRGHLSATSKGELLYSFPTGFFKPWEAEERLQAFFEKVKNITLGVLKFIVRAWISIVMVGYVVVFALIILGLSFSKSSDRDDDSGFHSSLMLHTLLRLVMDSLFWTFHPFSPFNVYRDGYDRAYGRKKELPFYERVNRFFFGPEEKKIDINDIKKKVLQEIRALKGRVGIFDIMRVTGMTKDEADPFMARLSVDYDGDIVVTDDGAIFYEFPSLRKTAQNETAYQNPPIWQEKVVMPAFTGNPLGSNVLIASLNGFNLLMSSFAISASLTIERLSYIFSGIRTTLPPTGQPLILGWVPFVFSLTLFGIPLMRAFLRPKKHREVNQKNGFRGLIKVILNHLKIGGIKEKLLEEGWTTQAGVKPSERELTRSLIKLGGDLEVSDEGQAVYRFRELEREALALKDARGKAQSSESYVGEVVFSSER